MANYCSNCGSSVSSGDSYCPNCGAALSANVNGNGTYTATNTNNSGVAKGAVAGALGTLVAVTLASGLTRNLYYYGGRYFLDPYCRRPFYGGIMGPHRMIGGPPPHGGFMGPRGGMGGPHGGMGGGPGGGHGGPGGGGRR